MDEERNIAEKQWASRKLSLVPGDELLDGVCQRYGVRFRKERDAQRLASLVEPAEVPSALAELLKRIAQK
jgi:hypothetical protein